MAYPGSIHLLLLQITSFHCGLELPLADCDLCLCLFDLLASLLQGSKQHLLSMRCSVQQCEAGEFCDRRKSKTGTEKDSPCNWKPNQEPLYPEAAQEPSAFCDIAWFNSRFCLEGSIYVFRLHALPHVLAAAPLQMLPRGADKQGRGKTTVRAEQMTTKLDSSVTDTYTAELMQQGFQGFLHLFQL